MDTLYPSSPTQPFTPFLSVPPKLVTFTNALEEEDINLQRQTEEDGSDEDGSDAEEEEEEEELKLGALDRDGAQH
ncbi:hypothetical protein IAR50_004306 [Cryptococcus sp. DSM 104548]